MPLQPENAVSTDTNVSPAIAVQSPVLLPQSRLETNGPQGPEPTRYGDWERKGRCVDF